MHLYRTLDLAIRGGHRIAQPLNIQSARRAAMGDAAQDEDRGLCNIQALRIETQFFDVFRFVVIKRTRIVGYRQAVHL